MPPTAVLRARHLMTRFLARVATPVAVVSVFVVVAPAEAARTTVTWPSDIQVKAAPHTTNRITMFYELVKGADPADSSWNHYVVDRAGITTTAIDPPSCFPSSLLRAGNTRFAARSFAGKVVACPDGSTAGAVPQGVGEDFRVLLGDRSDRFTAGSSLGSFEVHAGSGNDTVSGNTKGVLAVDEGASSCGYFTEDELDGDGGNDRLNGRLGPDLLSGGPGNDHLDAGKAPRRRDIPGGRFCAGLDNQSETLRGGSGKDVLRAVNGARDHVDCGPGRDKAFLDRRDPKPKHCESVKRR
jgi:RTX calcium-binding nonapeptide repeat (4 copies)